MKSAIYKHVLRTGQNELLLHFSSEIKDFEENVRTHALELFVQANSCSEKLSDLKPMCLLVLATEEDFDPKEWTYLKTAHCQDGSSLHLLVKKGSGNGHYQQNGDTCYAN